MGGGGRGWRGGGGGGVVGGGVDWGGGAGGGGIARIEHPKPQSALVTELLPWTPTAPPPSNPCGSLERGGWIKHRCVHLLV